MPNSPRPENPHRSVRIRGLSINGTGASGTAGTRTGLVGIRATAGTSLFVEDTVIGDFSQQGIQVQTSAAFNLSLDRVVIRNTNSSGVARFRILGASNVASASAAGIGEGCATVTADGVPLGSYSVATADLNGTGGVAGQDLLQFNAALLSAPSCNPCYRSRVNFAGAGPGVIDGQDLLNFNGFLLGGGSSASAAAYCP